MNLYIYGRLTENPVIKNLLAWRETGAESCYYAACRGLISARAGLGELIAAALLEAEPAGGVEAVRAYFDRDINEIYSGLAAFDWDAACEKSGLLPLPDFAPGGAGADDYRTAADGLAGAGSAAAFGEIVAGFFRKYACADEAKFAAFSWKNGRLAGVPEPDGISFGDLAALGYRKDVLVGNTAAFTEGRPAQDILLAGASGTGKSSCVKAVFNMFRPRGLKIAELLKEDVSELPALMEEINKRKNRYLIYIDDLSFDGSDADFKALKVALDGRVGKRPANTLIYATSNRVHLVRESWKDREAVQDIHENETMHEKMSLSERFGIRLYFQYLTQPEYLEIVALLLERHGVEFGEAAAKEAVAWELRGNGRSGRTAKQFVTDYLSRFV
ncbi:MAG: ATP-binding protein [Firmicutes bacterium]|nr:ATP-binding protein [Bacillota bacterium]